MEEIDSLRAGIKTQAEENQMHVHSFANEMKGFREEMQSITQNVDAWYDSFAHNHATHC
jgi:hypothetical protein